MCIALVQCSHLVEAPSATPPSCPLAEEPLLLYSCDYGGLQFRRTAANYGLVRSQLEDMLTRCGTKGLAGVARCCCKALPFLRSAC